MNRRAATLIGVMTLAFVPASEASDRKLIISGETYWSNEAYGIVSLPDGTAIDPRRAFRVQGPFIVNDTDTLVYDPRTQTVTRHVQTTPHELLSQNPEFAGSDLEFEVAPYDPASGLLFSAIPGYGFRPEELNQTGLVITHGEFSPARYQNLGGAGSPVQPDTDSDTVPDAHDAAPNYPNDNADLDGDGDVDRNDLAVVLTARNSPTNGDNDVRDIDGDGVITVLDARKLVLLCSRPHCAIE